MGLIGADPEVLDQLGQRASAAARQFRTSANSITGGLSRTRWDGHDAGDFRRRWTNAHRPLLHSSADVLDELSRLLAQEAREQRIASEGGGGDSLGGGVAAPGGPVPTGSGGRSALQEQYAETRRGMESDLEKGRKDLRELKERRARDRGGLGDRIADLNPLDEGDTEKQDRLIRAKETEVRRLEALLTNPDRKFLKVDVRGDGRIIEVLGDLESADYVAIHIPGMGTDIDKYLNEGHTDANKLYNRLDAERRGKVAVIQFLDYDAPDDVLTKNPEKLVRAGLEVSGEGLAHEGATNLSTLVSDLGKMGVPSDKVSLVAHSYGSVLAGIALKEGLDVRQVLTLGSPGLGDGVDDLSDLGTDVPVWSAQAKSSDPRQHDWVPELPPHGENPADPGFGARTFDGGSNGHSRYFEGAVLDRISKIIVYDSPAGAAR